MIFGLNLPKKGKIEESIFVNDTIATTSSYFEAILLNSTESSVFVASSLFILYIWPLDRENSQRLAVEISSKIRLPIFFQLWSFWHLTSRYLIVFSDKPVSTDKADVNFIICFLDGIFYGPSSRICLYKLDDAFSHRTQMDNTSGEYRRLIVIVLSLRC